MTDARAEAADAGALEAIAQLYHAWFTGLVLMLVGRRSAADAEALVFRVFREQHLARFLPGLEKLGLAGEPHAVACAKYHYFSNQLGGVKVEFLAEDERKAWIRYPPPRWIWSGTAICAIPTEVNRAMLRGWHAHNGVSLGNPRLGFVCTKATVDGQPGLEGYYLEYDRELAPEERLAFAPGESAPPIDPADLPRLDAESWPEARRQKASRNYAMEYLRNALPALVARLGPAEGGHLGRLSARLTGMHGFDAALGALGRTIPAVAGNDAAGMAATRAAFAEVFCALARAQGDEAEWTSETGGRVSITQRGWRLARGMSPRHPAIFEAWNGLWEGAAAACNRHLEWRVDAVADDGAGDAPTFRWRL